MFITHIHISTYTQTIYIFINMLLFLSFLYVAVYLIYESQFLNLHVFDDGCIVIFLYYTIFFKVFGKRKVLMYKVTKLPEQRNTLIET